MDFEGRNPEPQDFHGIKQLLRQLFLKAHVDLSQMTDLLIKQNSVGSVLKQTIDEEDDDDDLVDSADVYGITSVLNLHANKVIIVFFFFGFFLRRLPSLYRKLPVFSNFSPQSRSGFINIATKRHKNKLRKNG